MAEPVADQLAKARSDVNRACNLLIAPTPQALVECQEALESAVSALKVVRSLPREGHASSSDRAVATALGAEVSRASRLLQNLASFYRGWERILGTMSGGYTASGNPAPVARQGRLCCRL